MAAPARARLHALIEEAKRRARQRRLVYGAIVVVLACVGVAAGLVLSNRPEAAEAPPGFTFAKARGPVAHIVIQTKTSPGVRITSLSGQDRPANTVEEVWYDARGGLWRDELRIGGRVRSDRAGVCSKELCDWGSAPLSYLRPFAWPGWLSDHPVSRTGTYRGLPVVWLEGKSKPVPNALPDPTTTQVGLDPRTHRLVVERDFARGRLENEVVISKQSTLPAGTFSFLLRKGAAGGPPNTLSEPLHGHLLAYGFPAARKALGATPFWLGPRFRGYVLRSVQSGTYPFGTTKTGALEKAPFVRFYYGTQVGQDYRLSVEEFGSIRPYFYAQGPRPGEIERDGTFIARLTRAGLLLRVSAEGGFRTPSLLLTSANAIALAKALRPLPPGMNDLPTLAQE